PAPGGLFRVCRLLASAGERSHKRIFFSRRYRRAKPALMKNEPQIPKSQALALERFAFITQIQDLLRQGFPLSVALEQVSFRPLNLPDGTQRLCARRTIEDWWYAYQKGGFAALTPKVRADKGQPRTLAAQQQKWILE